MAAYVIANVEVTDQAKFREYSNQVPLTLEKYGRTYLVRGGATEKAEGDWEPSRMVVIQFESMEQVMKWYNSEEYRGPMQLRHQSANTNLVFIEGIS